VSSHAQVIDNARDAYREFHWGVPARKVDRRAVSPRPTVLVGLGTLHDVTYATNKKGDGPSLYNHKFEGKKPLLAMDFDNERLHVVGGSYTVTKRGIEG
jgi:hypothetical protein